MPKRATAFAFRQLPLTKVFTVSVKRRATSLSGGTASITRFRGVVVIAVYAVDSPHRQPHAQTSHGVCVPATSTHKGVHRIRKATRDITFRRYCINHAI